MSGSGPADLPLRSSASPAARYETFYDALVAAKAERGVRTSPGTWTRSDIPESVKNDERVRLDYALAFGRSRPIISLDGDMPWRRVFWRWLKGIPLRLRMTRTHRQIWRRAEEIYDYQVRPLPRSRLADRSASEDRTEQSEAPKKPADNLGSRAPTQESEAP